MPTSDPNSNILVSFILLLIIAGLTSYYAERKGRSPAAWFVIGILIGFFAPLILFFLPSLKNEEAESETEGQPKISNSSATPPPIPLLKKPEEELWYYLDRNHQQFGPVSIIALKELWDTGRLGLTSYVWTEGMDKWEKVDHLPELKASLNKVHA